MLDDENDDGKMNYNFLGAPKEGYGFCNYEHTGFGKPDFSNFAVDINHGLNKLKVNMQYIFKKNFNFAIQLAGCSAAGSALRSGRRGRWFESSHPDHATLAQR